MPADSARAAGARRRSHDNGPTATVALTIAIRSRSTAIVPRSGTTPRSGPQRVRPLRSLRCLHTLRGLVPVVSLAALLQGCLGPRQTLHVVIVPSGRLEWLQREPSDRISWTPLLEEFRRLHPDVQLQVSAVPEEELEETLRRDRSRGLGPDLMVVRAPVANALLRQGLVERLDDQPLWQRNRALLEPSVSGRVITGAGVSGLPVYGLLTLACFDRRVVPQPPTSLDALLALAASGRPIGVAVDPIGIWWSAGALGAQAAMVPIITGNPQPASIPSAPPGAIQSATPTPAASPTDTRPPNDSKIATTISPPSLTSSPSATPPLARISPLAPTSPPSATPTPSSTPTASASLALTPTPAPSPTASDRKADRAHLLAWLTWLRQLTLQSRVDIASGPRDLVDGLVSGRLSWIPCYSATLAHLERRMGQRLGVAPLPSGPAGPPTPFSTMVVLALGSDSSLPQRRLALELAELSLDPVVQREFTLQSRMVLPANRFVPVPVASSGRLAALEQAQRQFDQRSRLLSASFSSERVRRLQPQVESLLWKVMLGAITPQQGVEALLRLSPSS